MNITKGKKKQAQKIVVYGPEGVGKTLLGSAMPNPLFADCEDGTKHLSVDRQDINKMDEFRETCLFLINSDHDYQSLVVDTVDWLATKDTAEMLDEDDTESVEDYGYGKGYKKAEERFGAILDLLDRVVNRGIHVCLLAHSKIVKFEEPDKGGAYDRYEIKCEKRITPLVKEWCRTLLFYNYETRIVEQAKGDKSEKKRAVGGKVHILHTEHTAAYDAKNRQDLPDKITVEKELAKIQQVLTPLFDLPDVQEHAAPAKESAELKPLQERFDAVVELAGGADDVQSFLDGRNLKLDTLDDDYKERVCGAAGGFVKQVKEHSEKGGA